MTRTFWLSFCNDSKPEGQQFLGACVVDVTAEQAALAKLDLAQKFPQHMPGAEWVAAAMRSAHAHGCNPGGQVASYDITGIDPPEGATMPKFKLMSRAEMEALGLEPRSRAELEAEDADA